MCLCLFAFFYSKEFDVSFLTGGGSDGTDAQACPGTRKYTLERHDFDNDHGDVCRDKLGGFTCPEGCTATSSGRDPFCVNGRKLCRIPRSKTQKSYRCDSLGGERGVCVSADRPFAKYKDATCDGKCASRKKFQCQNDWDCSLAGVCNAGTCDCDPWVEGEDCSYLRFQPVDRSKVGYLDSKISSWGGSVVRGSDGMWHMFVSEILCDKDDLYQTRCGLKGWQTNSQVAHVVSENVEGPYTRLGVVLSPEHHNPTVAISPVDGTWYLYSISGHSGPIDVVSSTDDGYTWTDPKTVSKMQNPGPVLHDDGKMTMFYRGDGDKGTLPPPTCSEEFIGMQSCSSPMATCQTGNGKPIFSHTAEDPMIFRDHRGHYHMLMNVFPGACTPKDQQGGHAWSRDGVTWSEPRVGAFITTISLSDGSYIKCTRRERPQMIMDPDRPGVPLALVSGLVACPPQSFGPAYKGAGDSFTLVQMMGQSS